LWAIHERRATASAAPNFAYELCARKVRDDAIEGLDLSSWRCALNGAESVSVGTLERFARRFERYGFRREALMPVYGLAESAVALSFPPVGRAPRIDHVTREAFEQSGHAVPALEGDPTALAFVSVGRPLPEHEVRIVGDDGEDVRDRAVGRLVFRGPSCMPGYYRNPQATTSATFEESWLESGDLAYRADGELYITGREKDLIIKGGRNLVPQEVEEITAGVDGIRRGCIAAFGLAEERTGTERLVVLAESRATSEDERARLAREVTASIAAALGIPPDDVRIVPPATVPKTPSGKIRRSAARDLYIAGRLGGAPRVPVRLRARLAVFAAADLLRKTARRVGRGLYVCYVSVASAVALALVGPLVSVSVHLLPRGRLVRVLGRLTSRLALAISGCRVTVEGRERLPRAGPLVLVANHTSYADTPTLTVALPIDFVFVAMQEILAWRLIGTFARRGDHPVVDRFHPQRSVAGAHEVEARLRAGEAVLFFPEGTFVAASGLRPFRLGAFEAAVATGAPVVPIALAGTRRTLRVGDRFPRPGRINVWIGEPLRADGEGWHAAIALRDRAAAAIAAHCGEPRLDLATARV
jgi:1-acyl-sn-glycerol-3-phosphate acyltransferase